MEMEIFLLGAVKASSPWYDNPNLWQALKWLLLYIAIPIAVAYIGSAIRVKKLEFKLKQIEKQSALILKAYKKIKTVESWGNRAPSEYGLQELEDILDETVSFLYEKEFYIPNHIYKKSLNLLNGWGHISDKYSQYLKGKKGEIEYRDLDVGKDIEKLIKKRKLLEKSIKKKIGYA
ncbi:hypothetical protein FC89_GL000284 [Liquorilactobacillus ghanensis DSM 18630]|uniref:Uncharacterized protein n=2 Tax=Liquorilactobacillus ghanensis TaxID=399370 RepID=A0A0R1VNJ4_9LACO|nr:hypothetical protein FC89_GL000284 [Liquorilactobacillus ghanensis DSM 18630]